MPLNPNIFGMYKPEPMPSPVDAAARMYSLKNAMMQSEQAERQFRMQDALRQAVAQSGGDVESAMKAALASGNVEAAARLAPILEVQRKAAQQPRGQPIGSGGLRLPDGTIIPPAARPDAGLKAPPTRTLQIGNEKVIQELQTDGTWKELSRGPQFARQVAPVVNIPRPTEPPVAAIHPVTGKPFFTTREDAIKRGLAPASMDASLQGSISGAKAGAAARAKADEGRKFNMSGIGAIIQNAEDVLYGIVRDPKTGEVDKSKTAELPTGSVIGTAWDTAGALVGKSPKGSVAAQKARVIGAALVAKMPRMEGPQSDRDVQLYKEAAAEIGNSNVPVDRRRAALQTVKDLWAKYEHLNPGTFEDSKQGGNSTGKAPPGVPQEVWDAMPDKDKALWK